MLAYSGRFSYPDSWTGNHPTQTQHSGHLTSAASLLTHPPTERLAVEPCSWGVSIMPCCMLASMYGGITAASSLLQWHHSLKRAALKGSSCSLQHISDITWPYASLLTSVAAPHSPDANAIHLHLHEALLQHAIARGTKQEIHILHPSNSRGKAETLPWTVRGFLEPIFSLNKRLLDLQTGSSDVVSR